MNSIEKLWQVPIGRYLHHYQYNSARYKYAGIVAVIGFILFYFLYTEISPQKYENLSIRLGAVALGLLMASKDYWTGRWERYYPIIPYVTIIYALPFFHTYMVCMNDAGIAYVVDSLMAVFFLMLLVDWLNGVIVFVVGTVLGALAYVLVADNPQLPLEYVLRIPTIILIFVGVWVFSNTTRLIDEEKMRSMLALSAHMAHEIRTPLAAIKASASGASDYLPELVRSYEQARQHSLTNVVIPKGMRSMLGTSLQHIQSEVDRINSILNVLLVNLRREGDKSGYGLESITSCIEDCMARYPFREGERDKIHLFLDTDFEFRGSRLLVTHVLFNLLNNALYSIRVTGDGAVGICVRQQGNTGLLYFSDSGKGIPKTSLPHLFEPFFSTKPSDVGTGVGLYFCKRVMEEFGGNIQCHSEEGVYAEFELSFPNIAKPSQKPSTTSIG